MSVLKNSVLYFSLIMLIQIFGFSQDDTALVSPVKKQYDSLINLYENVYTEATRERSEVIKLLATNSFEGRNTLSSRINYLLDGISILEKWDSTKLLIKAYNSLGNFYWLNGDLDNSIHSVYRVAELAKSIKDNYWEAAAYANLGASYKSQKAFREALKFENRALKLYSEQKDTLTLFNIRTSIAETYYLLNRIDSSILFVEKALRFFIKYEDPSFAYVNALLQTTQAKIVAKQGNYDSAKLLIDSSTEVFGRYKNSQLDQQTALHNIELGKIFIEDSKPNEAIEFAIKGYEIGVKNGLKEVIQDGSFVLAKAYEIKNQDSKAIKYYKTYYAYRDSIVNVENVKQIESLRADFEINQKQTELDIVEVQRRNQELISYITAVILLVILVLAIIVFRSYRQKNALSKKLASINESKNKLFSIISHDLRGPMAAFSGVGFMIKSAMESDDKSFLEEVANEVDKSSKQLSSLLENLLGWAMQEQDGLTVHHEKINVKEVFEELRDTFESQAKIKNIQITIQGVQACDVSADKNMTYTIFRNLISNALKFTPENGEIKVLSTSENEMVKIEVHDTGVGMSQDKVDALFQFDSKKSTYGTSGEKGLGLGLQLVFEFVTINKGTIQVDSEEGKGTIFKINLPLFSS